MYTTSLSLDYLLDTRKPQWGMQLLVNGQYIIIVGIRDLFIITNDEGKDKLDKKIKQGVKFDSTYFISKYNYINIKDIYCISKKDKLKYRNYFTTFHVLCVSDDCYKRHYKRYKSYVSISDVRQRIKVLIGDEEIIYWYMILKLFLIDDILPYIFKSIL